jgi:hypothetical protein
MRRAGRREGAVRRLISPAVRACYGVLGKGAREWLARLPGAVTVYQRIGRPLLFPPCAEDGVVEVEFPEFSL